jgi:hypothetical protein
MGLHLAKMLRLAGNRLSVFENSASMKERAHRAEVPPLGRLQQREKD